MSAQQFRPIVADEKFVNARLARVQSSGFFMRKRVCNSMPSLSDPSSSRLSWPALAVAGMLLAQAAPACDVQQRKAEPDLLGRIPDAVLHDTACVNGFAAGFACSNIDLRDRLPLSAFAVPGLPAPSSASMLWGYTDTQTGKEYVLLGLDNSLAIVALDGADGHAQLLGRLPTHTGNSIWRDVRVYRDHAYIVSDSNGAHGMQIFDLRQLRTLQNPPVIFAETAHYGAIRNTHTIAINEATGFAYLAGTNTCQGGLHMVDLKNPQAPVFAGCFGADGYTHEAQCWTYTGPDAQHSGKEICLASNVDSLTTVDVSDKSAASIVSSISYANRGYVHQAWFTPDFRYVLLNDELDEQNFGLNGRTLIFDYSDLDAPVLKGSYTHPRASIDHNLYIRNNFVYESNYTSGLRILAMTNLASAQLTEVGFFDIYPANDGASFNGNWGNYPFFESGRVVLSGIAEGLFVVRPNICTPPAAPSEPVLSASAPNQVSLSWNAVPNARFRVQRATGGCGVDAGPFETLADGLSSASYVDTNASGGTRSGYRVQSTDATGACGSVSTSACVEVVPSGACTAAPLFNGLTSASSANQSSCGVNLSWTPARASCSADALQYSVYRSTDPLFAPNASNRIAVLSGANGALLDAPEGTRFNYIVRAKHAGNNSEETNLLLQAAAASGPLANATFFSGAEVGQPILTDGGVVIVGKQSGDQDANATRHVGWHISSTAANTGLRSYDSTIGSNYCLSLETPALTLSVGQSSEFSFTTRHSLPATGRDGGTLEMSIDGGPWLPASTNETTPGGITQTGNACGLPVGRRIFNGTRSTWDRYSVNLTAQAGRQVRFRFLLATGNSVPANFTGWLVDDVAISNVQLPGVCTPVNSDQIFRNGFEQ
jgi:choice-of-anchor B domain-containing protein